jgi:RimJ/RimL family protein N-acetyltransferase
MDIKLIKIDYSNKNLLDKIFTWRNDPDTIINSINNNNISTEDFKKIIVSYKNSTLDPLIVFENNIEIGILSFNNNNNNKIFIGINIDKNYRSKGIGNKVIEIFCKEYKDIHSIYAKIKKHNIPSIKIFSKFFKYYDEDELYITYLFTSKNI